MRKMSVPAVAALFLAACSPQAAEDPAAPARYLEVAPPDWTKSLSFDVKKHSCSVSVRGETFQVDRNGTDVGNGLQASRDFNDCYVQDTDGVLCNWNLAEKIDWCRMANPQYNAYLTAKNNIHF